MNKNEFVKIALVWMLSRWRQFLDRDTIFLRDFVGWKRAKMKNGWERGLMTQDRPTHDHKRKRLLRASDENHFPTEIQIFMLSIRSSWNYYRPITTLSLSLVMRMYRKWIHFGRSTVQDHEKTWYFIIYILQEFKQFMLCYYYRHWKLCLMKLCEQ